MNDLLPPNNNSQERALSEVISKVLATPIPVRDVWNPFTCPVHILPWLAWSYSVDDWDPSWPIETKRQIIADSIEFHRIKGTRRAVEKALEPFGASVVLSEWWEQSPQGIPHTFTANVVGQDLSSNLNKLYQVEQAINKAKPVRSHFQLSVSQDYSAGFKITMRALMVTIWRASL